MMDYVKLEDVEYEAIENRLVNETCVLEDNDIQCGSVVYNEDSRVLKFICIISYCQKAFDNIEYFCQHLTEHITEHGTKSYHEMEETEAGEIIYRDTGDTDDMASHNSCFAGEYDDDTQFSQHTEDPIYHQGEEYAEVNMPMENDLDTSDMIEEIGENEDIESYEQTEDLSLRVCGGDVPSLLDNSSQDVVEYEGDASEGDNTVPLNVHKNNNSFEDCFLKESNIEKIRSQGICVLKEGGPQSRPLQKKRTKAQDLLRLRRSKGKKVTTVKVIAVKNRIAELYDRIKNEQAKSQQMLACNGFLQQGHSIDSINMAHMEQETQDALESLPKNVDEENLVREKCALDFVSRENMPKEVTRKIIGETLITLIPEGTKIPNTLPSPVERLPSNIDINPSKKEEDNIQPPFKYTTTNDKKAVCPACGKTFRSHFSLTIHKRIHYLESDSSVKLAHKCPDCDQLFNKLSQLKQHVESVHYPDGFVCKICNRKLSSLSLLERHMVKVHLDRPFNCQQCGKNFSDPVTYEEHIISHNSGEVYKCHICGRKYSTEFFLMEHMRNHKEQVPNTCVVCGKVTLRITQHMKIHTPRPKRLLSCSVCGKVFNFSSGLSHHFKIMHKLPRPPPKPKKEPNPNAQKRKRKTRSTEKASKKKDILNISSETSFNTSGQIIEEPSEVPEEVYDEDPQTMLAMSTTTEQHPQQSEDGQSHINHLLDHLKDEDVNHKEEEAKRVIVELIQNSSYTSFFPDNLSSVLEVTPPIAREETISAVNSIVHDC